MSKVAKRVAQAETFEACGHGLAPEAGERLALLPRDFMLGR